MSKEPQARHAAESIVELRWLSGLAQRLPNVRGETFGDLAVRARIDARVQRPLKITGAAQVFGPSDRVDAFLPGGPFTVVVAQVGLGVPEGLHHGALDVSEDRLTVCMTSGSPSYKYSGCFLTGALERDGVHLMQVRIHGPRRLLYVGITGSGERDFAYLPMLAVHQDPTVPSGFYDDSFNAEIYAQRRDVDLAFQRGVITLAVNMHEGRVSLLSEELEEVAYALVSNLRDHVVCFSASIFRGSAECGLTKLTVLREESADALAKWLGRSSRRKLADSSPRSVSDSTDDSDWLPEQQCG